MISRDHDFVFSVVDSNKCDKIRTIRPRITCNNARNIDLRYLQFSSVLFSQNKLQYKNTFKNCKLAREPRRNQRFMKPGLPSHKEISKVKIRGQ